MAMKFRLSRRRLLQGACSVAAVARPNRLALADSETLDVRSFGAIGDGLADDTEAFVALHAFMKAQQDVFPDRRFVVELPPGHYRYHWNRWTWGIRRITIRGHRATIQCVSDSAFDLDKYALVTNRDFFDTANEREAPGKSHRSGHPIMTARSGDWSVTLKTPADSTERLVGHHVLILSYDQQFYGYPPNCRYFDFARVAGIEAGRVRLDRPLRNLHRDDYPGASQGVSCGPARLLAIDLPDVPLALEQRLTGLTTLPNPNRQGMGQHVAAIGVLDFVAEDCRFVSFVASCGDRFRLTRTSIDDLEPDKLVNEIGLFDCRLGTVTEATGVNQVSFRNCEFLSPVQQEARDVSYDACVFRGGLGPGRYQSGIHLRGFAPTRTLSIRRCEFHGRREPTAIAVADNPLVGLRIAKPIRLLGSGRYLEMPAADEAARGFLSALEGAGLLLVDSGSGEPACDGRYGVVKEISADRRRVRVKVAFSSTVREGEWLWVPRVRRIVAQNNTFQGINAFPPWAPTLIWDEAVDLDGTHHWRLASEGPADTLRIVSAIPVRITIDVTRPYRGSEPEAFLRLFSVYPEYGSIHLAVNCREAGRRVVDVSAASGGQPGDELTLLPADRFVWSLKLQFASGPKANENPLPGRSDRQAHCRISLVTRAVFPS